MYTVKLQYFRSSGGKFYSEGEYETEKEFLFEIWDELKYDMLARGIRPGLVDGHDGFHVLVNVPGHPHEHPRLLVGAA